MSILRTNCRCFRRWYTSRTTENSTCTHIVSNSTLICFPVVVWFREWRMMTLKLDNFTFLYSSIYWRLFHCTIRWLLKITRKGTVVYWNAFSFNSLRSVLRIVSPIMQKIVLEFLDSNSSLCFLTTSSKCFWYFWAWLWTCCFVLVPTYSKRLSWGIHMK